MIAWIGRRPYTKIKSKSINGLNINTPNCETSRREHKGKNLHNIGLGKDFMGMALKTQSTKTKIKSSYNTVKGNPQNGRVYLQTILLIRIEAPKCISKAYNS